MPLQYEDIETFLRDEISVLTGAPAQSITADTVLVGAGRVVDSADLVMLLISVEDFAREKMGATFDWTSDSAMSAARSVLRNVGSLADHLLSLSPT